MNMTIPNKNIQDSAYQAMGQGAKATFPSFSGSIMQDIQATLTADLKKQGIDFNSLSPVQKHATLNKFLETNYEHDTALLSDNVQRGSVAKENYFLDEIIVDESLSSYIDKVQGNIPFAQGIIAATLKKVSAIDGMPDGFKKEVVELLERHKSKPLSSIDVFRTNYKAIVDKYDPDVNPKATELGALTPEQKKQLSDISIDNKSILEGLKESGDIADEEFDTITNKQYQERPDNWKKVWATNLRKQFVHSYIGLTKHTEGVGEGMESLVKMPTIEAIFGSYAKKLGIPYDEMVEKSKPAIMFSTRSPQEKQAIMDTLVEEYYLPNAQKFGAKLGLDVKQYESFVRQLFSLDTKELAIPGPQGNAIKLNFLKKDINATIPVESMLQSRMEDILPLDFVLDGSDAQEMQKLATTMPGKNWHTINGSRYDPQQILSLHVGEQTTIGYGYKIMHGGEEMYVITEKYVPQSSSADKNMKVLTKDGTYKRLSETKEADVIMLHTTNNPTNDAYKIGAKEPLVYSMQPHDVQGLLTAYCLNNSSNLSDQDKAKLFAPVPKPQALTEFFADEILGKDEETQKRIKDQEQHTGESPESYEQRMKETAEMAMQTWDSMLGYKGTKFEKGTQLAIQNIDSIFTDIPGNGGYMMLEITDADNREHPTKFKYKILGGVESDITSGGASLSGQESNRLDFSDEFFAKLKDYGNGTLYKFPPKSEKKGIIDYAKDINFGNTGMDQLASRFGLLTQDGNDLINNAKDKIKYFGVDIVQYDDKGKDSKSYAMFETSFSDDEVKIKDKSGSYSRTMSFPEFLIFAADKGLHAYSQKEYKDAMGPEEMNNAKSKTAIFVMSPMNIIHGVKKWYEGTITAGVKRSNERRVDKIEEMFYTSGLTNMLGNVPIRGEYFVQAQDSYDGKLADKHHKIVMEGDSTINQRGKKLVRGKQTFLDNHNLKGPWRESCLDKIIEIFDKVDQGKALDDVERREGMAGLLYVLDKFQTPYPRRLAKYAGKHLWPRMLLNDEKYKQYMRGFNDAQLKLKTGQARGEDVRELMDNVMHYDVKNMSELMKDVYHRGLYGYKSIPVLQEHSEKRTNDTARKDGLQAAGHHPAFERAYREEVLIKLNYGQYSYAIGGLIQISKRKEMSNPANYRRWLTGVIQVIVSGGMRYAANRSDRKYLRDFLRKHGFPISDYILDNAQGGKDLATLLDVISSKAGCNKSFSQATGWDPKLETYESWSTPKQGADARNLGSHADFNGKMDKWFLGERNAEKIIPFLENSNLDSQINLATLAKDPSLTDDQRGVIARYLNVSLNANTTRDFDAYRGADDFVQNLIQERTIFNTSRWLVQEEYMNYQKGGFGKNEEAVQYFRNALRNQTRKYAATDPKVMPRESIELILQKFYGMFQNQYGGDHQWFAIMLAHIKKAKTHKQKMHYARAGISRYIENYNFNPIPPMVREALQCFDNFFVNHIDQIDDNMIESLFSFEDIDGIASEKQTAIQIYKDIIHSPEKARAYAPQIQDYMDDLFSGRNKQKTFEGLQDGYKSTKNRKYDDEGLAMEAEQSEMNVQQQLTQQALADAARQEQMTKEEAQKQEAERKRKEKEAEEERQRQAEAAKKNEPEPA